MTIRRHAVLASAMILVSSAVNAQTKQPYNDRKASAKATIAGSHGTYDGTFVASNIASVCGEVPADRNFSGVASFIVEYPRDVRDNDQIQSIAFGSSKLAGKATSTTDFLLNIAVIAKDGGRPYAYVLNTSGNPRATGAASLTKNKDRSVTLNIRGKNDAGETIQMSVTCM